MEKFLHEKSHGEKRKSYPWRRDKSNLYFISCSQERYNTTIWNPICVDCMDEATETSIAKHFEFCIIRYNIKEHFIRRFIVNNRRS